MSLQQTANRPGGWLLILFGIVLVIIGLPMIVGGIQLIGLGGSWYYALAGAGLVVAGILYAMRRLTGLWVFLLVFLATVAWAFWEAGLTFWPQVPRLGAPAVIGVFALLFTPLFPAFRGRKRVPFAVAALLVVGLAATAFYAFVPHGVTRNAPPQAAAAGVPPAAASATDWRSYGRTPAGTRYAPIDQINRDNVDGLEVAWTFQSGDVADKGSEDQNTPLQVGDTVYT